MLGLCLHDAMDEHLDIISSLWLGYLYIACLCRCSKKGTARAQSDKYFKQHDLNIVLCLTKKASSEYVPHMHGRGASFFPIPNHVWVLQFSPTKMF